MNFLIQFLQNEASKPDSPLLAEGASPLLVDNGPLSGPLHIQTEAQAEAIAEQTIGNKKNSPPPPSNTLTLELEIVKLEKENDQSSVV